MSIIQKLKAELDKFYQEMEKLFNNKGGNPVALKDEVPKHVEVLKGKIQEHCLADNTPVVAAPAPVAPVEDPAPPPEPTDESVELGAHYFSDPERVREEDDEFDEDGNVIPLV